MKLGQLAHRKGLVAALALGVVAFLYIRSRSGSTASSTLDPNTVDPATGLTYGAEQAAGLASTSSGGSFGTSGTTDSAATAAALEGLASGLSDLQTAQAIDEANIQSTTEAAAQLSLAYSDLTTLAAPGPTTLDSASTSLTPAAPAKRSVADRLLISAGFRRPGTLDPAIKGQLLSHLQPRPRVLAANAPSSPTPRASAAPVGASVITLAPVASPAALLPAPIRGKAVAV